MIKLENPQFDPSQPLDLDLTLQKMHRPDADPLSPGKCFTLFLLGRMSEMSKGSLAHLFRNVDIEVIHQPDLERSQYVTDHKHKIFNEQVHSCASKQVNHNREYDPRVGPNIELLTKATGSGPVVPLPALDRILEPDEPVAGWMHTAFKSYQPFNYPGISTDLKEQIFIKF